MGAVATRWPSRPGPTVFEFHLIPRLCVSQPPPVQSSFVAFLWSFPPLTVGIRQRPIVTLAHNLLFGVRTRRKPFVVLPHIDQAYAGLSPPFLLTPVLFGPS